MITPDLLAVLRVIHHRAPINRVELAQKLGVAAKILMPGRDNSFATGGIARTKAAVASLMKLGLVKGTSYAGDICTTEAGAKALGEPSRCGGQLQPEQVVQPRLIAGLCNNGLVTHRRRLG